MLTSWLPLPRSATPLGLWVSALGLSPAPWKCTLGAGGSRRSPRGLQRFCAHLRAAKAAAPGKGVPRPRRAPQAAALTRAHSPTAPRRLLLDREGGRGRRLRALLQTPAASLDPTHWAPLLLAESPAGKPRLASSVCACARVRLPHPRSRPQTPQPPESGPPRPPPPRPCAARQVAAALPPPHAGPGAPPARGPARLGCGTPCAPAGSPTGSPADS